MSEIFLQEDVLSLLDNRFIVIIGDSIQRGVYKDLVMLLQKNRYLADRDLRAKGEFTFSGDKLIEGGQYGEMTNGVRYREVRQYQTDYHLIRFYFITRCYNSYVESILSDLSKDPLPDAVIMNSCLWDISRYGPSSVEQYKKNLNTLFKRLRKELPKTCLIMWNMTLPISKKARGGVLIPEVEHLNVSLRLDILEANFYVHKLALEYGFNTLDLHYYLRHQLQRRAGDGVHWDMTAHRRMTNLILTHMAEAWGVKSPENAKKVLLKHEQPLKKTSNRPKNFNSNFNFGLGNTGQSKTNVPERSQFVGNYIHNMVNNRYSVMQNIQMSGIGNQPIPQMMDSNLVARQYEHLRSVRQNVDVFMPSTNFSPQGYQVRNANFMGVDMSGMRIPDSLEMLNQPYGNQNFEPGLRGQGFGYQQGRERNLPYRSANRGLDPASHAYFHAF
ncbi:PC-esterase domain-containing protein 1A-like [Mercenaria mercenaria]|uniref:PC-esterase domain-containing protein 1A-like n=1 Tax=Mercenaria mercenaria TaxID=6596 RepID=UPI00234F6F65|nr:PC-esterase domain-containing protein 1A-like [Mercenaria mercenaria]XP_045191185.2 PC-esterase domain-containing protein 1A-like [Mercenaria mercenaria]XP_045191186.2 PC-esterase domain-containing protein 1A-like [Mercenaria mercenaria]